MTSPTSTSLSMQGLPMASIDPSDLELASSQGLSKQEEENGQLDDFRDHPGFKKQDSPGASSTPNKPRIYYMDKLRTCLTLLVVVHHCFWVVIAGWFPFQRPWSVDVPTLVFGFMFVSGNQAYFMGLFFFLAGVLTGPSIKRKGSWVFLKDRFFRLMIPAIVYDFILNPLLFCFVEATWYGRPHDLPESDFAFIFENSSTPSEVFASYFKNLSMHLTLFAMNLTCVIFIEILKSWKSVVLMQQSRELMTSREMFCLLTKISFTMVVLNFLLRIPFTSGYMWFPVVGNMAFIMQYTVAFTCGILANSYQVLDHLSKQHLLVTLSCSLCAYFLFLVFQTFLVDFFRATLGFYGLTFFITLFEQVFAVFWSYSLLVLFKEYQNRKLTVIFTRASSSAYATYIIHQWIIIPLAVGLAYTNITPIVVILILVALAPFLAWCSGMLLKAVPGSSSIL